MVLLGDAGEELEAGTAVLVAVLHADLREDAGHRVGADASVDRGDRAVAAPAVSIPCRRGCRRRQQARTGELLDPDREAHVALAGLDRHDRRAQRRRAGRARVRDVVDGDAGLADLLLQRLADPEPAAHEVARGEHADVGHRRSGVGERALRGFSRQVDGVLVGALPELRHVDPEDPDVQSLIVVSLLLRRDRFEAEPDRLDTLVVLAQRIRREPDLHPELHVLRIGVDVQQVPPHRGAVTVDDRGDEGRRDARRRVRRRS